MSFPWELSLFIAFLGNNFSLKDSFGFRYIESLIFQRKLSFAFLLEVSKKVLRVKLFYLVILWYYLKYFILKLDFLHFLIGCLFLLVHWELGMKMDEPPGDLARWEGMCSRSHIWSTPLARLTFVTRLVVISGPEIMGT